MAEKNKGLGLPQQRGTFELKGIVTGCLKDKFFVEQKTKNGKDFRMINFGVKVDPNQTFFVTMNGMPQDNVYFSKRSEVKGEKPTTKAIPWKDRFTFKGEGFGLIGTNIGLEKVENDRGQEVNDVKHLTPFDATKYISEHLKDGMSVYVRGNLEFSHFTNTKEETQHSSKLTVTQISLCKPVDFEEENFVATASFQQPIVFTGGRKESEDTILESLVVNYQTIENVEFLVKDQKLAGTLKKNLKPYTALKVWGDIETVKNTETVEDDGEDDGWGQANPLQKVTGNYKKVLVITGADKDSLDRDTYKESEIDKALEAMKANETASKDYGENGDDWSGGKKPTAEEEEAW